MEFEDVSEKLEWEVRRVAAAFCVETFEREQELFYGPQALGITNGVARWVSPPKKGAPQVSFSAVFGETCLRWQLDESAVLRFLCVGNREGTQSARLFFDRQTWLVHPHISYNQQMARGLYRLGIEDADVLAQLNHPLYAHEKLELRLSLPREFWPKTWLDEEKAERTD